MSRTSWRAGGHAVMLWATGIIEGVVIRQGCSWPGAQRNEAMRLAIPWVPDDGYADELTPGFSALPRLNGLHEYRSHQRPPLDGVSSAPSWSSMSMSGGAPRPSTSLKLTRPGALRQSWLAVRTSKLGRSAAGGSSSSDGEGGVDGGVGKKPRDVRDGDRCELWNGYDVVVGDVGCVAKPGDGWCGAPHQAVSPSVREETLRARL